MQTACYHYLRAPLQSAGGRLLARLCDERVQLRPQQVSQFGRERVVGAAMASTRAVIAAGRSSPRLLRQDAHELHSKGLSKPLLGSGSRSSTVSRELP